MFLAEAWYCLARSVELGSSPIERWVIGRPLVAYRTADGNAVALAGRCPHRMFPLCEGGVDAEDRLVCGYHGLTFGTDGKCVGGPGNHRVSASTSVRAYPVVEQGPWVWVWMGDGAPRTDLLPQHPWLDDPGWTSVFGSASLDANYELLLENLVDLSHETALHSSTIGNDAVAETPVAVWTDDRTVFASRRMSGCDPPPLYAETNRLAGPIDRWQDVEMNLPGFYVLHVRLAPAGAPEDEGEFSKVIYAVTPETERATREIWAVARDFAVDDESVSEAMLRGVKNVVEEDVYAVTLQQRAIDEAGGPVEVHIRTDAPALAVRRALRRLVAEEADRRGLDAP